MQNCLLCPLKGLDRAADKVLTAWGKDLEVNIVRDFPGRLDQTASKVVIRLRCRGERDLNFLVTNFDKFAEISEFLVAILEKEARTLA